jgi:thioredoxin-like negative regulator of GroEL
LPEVQPRIRPTRRRVAAHGILDKWRQDNGIAVSDTSSSASAATLLQRQSYKPIVSVDADEDAPCPVECVTEVFSSDELQQALADAGDTTLVVVDFFKTACGACKFIYPGFVKLCKASTAGQPSNPPVKFLKHNVFDDEQEEVTQLCKQYNIRSVPKFLFFKGGQQVDSFSTRDKSKVAAAILKHAEPGSVEFGDWQPAVN